MSPSSSTAPTAPTGRCLCGAIHYRVNGDVGVLVNCHCQFCRRAHGAAFVTTTPIASTKLVITEGETLLARYKGRFFCSQCGSSLFNRPESTPAVTALVVSSLDEAPATEPAIHCNVESKAAWYEILDDKPQFDAFPPNADAVMEKLSTSD
jgi:hypothetical protein